MAKSKKQPASPYTGTWHIVSMSCWGEDYFNAEVQAFIEFEAKGYGSFQFGYVQGEIDWRATARGEEPAVEWSWDGVDGADVTPTQGRGWAVLKGNELHGMIYCHMGDESEFAAKKAKKKSKK